MEINNFNENINNMINSYFGKEVFNIKTKKTKPSFVLSKNMSQGNIFMVLGKFQQIINENLQILNPKNKSIIRNIKMSPDVKKFKSEHRYINVSNGEISEKENYERLVSEIREVIDFVIEFDNKEFNVISGGYNYEDFANDEITKIAFQIAKFPFKINLNTHVGLRLISCGGDYTFLSDYIIKEIIPNIDYVNKVKEEVKTKKDKLSIISNNIKEMKDNEIKLNQNITDVIF